MRFAPGIALLGLLSGCAPGPVIVAGNASAKLKRRDARIALAVSSVRELPIRRPIRLRHTSAPRLDGARPTLPPSASLVWATFGMGEPGDQLTEAFAAIAGDVTGKYDFERREIEVFDLASAGKDHRRRTAAILRRWAVRAGRL